MSAWGGGDGFWNVPGMVPAMDGSHVKRHGGVWVGGAPSAWGAQWAAPLPVFRQTSGANMWSAVPATPARGPMRGALERAVATPPAPAPTVPVPTVGVASGAEGAEAGAEAESGPGSGSASDATGDQRSTVSHPAETKAAALHPAGSHQGMVGQLVRALTSGAEEEANALMSSLLSGREVGQAVPVVQGLEPPPVGFPTKLLPLDKGELMRKFHVRVDHGVNLDPVEVRKTYLDLVAVAKLEGGLPALWHRRLGTVDDPNSPATILALACGEEPRDERGWAIALLVYLDKRGFDLGTSLADVHDYAARFPRSATGGDFNDVAGAIAGVMMEIRYAWLASNAESRSRHSTRTLVVGTFLKKLPKHLAAEVMSMLKHAPGAPVASDISLERTYEVAMLVISNPAVQYTITSSATLRGQYFPVKEAATPASSKPTASQRGAGKGPAPEQGAVLAITAAPVSADDPTVSAIRGGPQRHGGAPAAAGGAPAGGEKRTCFNCNQVGHLLPKCEEPCKRWKSAKGCERGDECALKKSHTAENAYRPRKQ